MKVSLIGSISTNRFDEGMNNVIYSLAKNLSSKHTVQLLSPIPGNWPRIWHYLRSIRPDIIHYMAGPTLNSLILLKLASLFSPQSGTIISALHPSFPMRRDIWIPLLRPDRVLVQSRMTEKLFRRRGCRTDLLSNGVDLDKFHPVAEETKSAYRTALGISDDKYIILHVGAIKAGRGVQLFPMLQGGSQQVLIVGNVSTGHEAGVLRNLESSGCWVWRKYVRDIEKVYALADCYIFPTMHPSYSIETPLSVLEAMATNLPIISSAFGGLPETFPEGEGLVYGHSQAEFIDELCRLRENRTRVRTREKVMENSWEAVTTRLENIYRSVLDESQRRKKAG